MCRYVYVCFYDVFIGVPHSRIFNILAITRVELIWKPLMLKKISYYIVEKFANNVQHLCVLHAL